MKLTFVIALFVLAESTAWLTQYESARAVATQDNKFILLNFSGSDWCAPCIKMKRNVFESELFLEYAGQNLVLLNADFPRLKKNQQSKEQVQHNEALAARYNRDGRFPYTLLLDAQGNVKKIWDGYGDQNAPQFVAELRKIIEP